jgi:hypothetical protein
LEKTFNNNSDDQKRLAQATAGEFRYVKPTLPQGTVQTQGGAVWFWLDLSGPGRTRH